MVQVESGTLETQGATIYHQTRGDASGVPLFVLHGGPGFNHTYFLASPVWDGLATGRQVVFYDQRGTGQSSPLTPDGSCTLANQLADLEALREHLGYERIDVLGHSWGGYLGMAYAVRHSASLRRLVLVDSVAARPELPWRFAEYFPDTWERWETLDLATRLGDAAATDELLKLHMSRMCCLPENRKAWPAAIGSSSFQDDVFQKLWADAQQYDLTPALSQLVQPTLVATGRFDVCVPPAIAYQIYQAIPHSEFVVFETSGHVPFFEEPEAFARVVEEFLAAA